MSNSDGKQIQVSKIRPEIMAMAIIMEAMLPDNSTDRFWQNEPRESHYVGVQESLRKADDILNQTGAFHLMNDKIKDEFCWKLVDIATFSTTLLGQMGFLLKADLRMGKGFVDFVPHDVKNHLDFLVRFWRMRLEGQTRDGSKQGIAEAVAYIDAFQTVRKNLFGEALPEG